MNWRVLKTPGFIVAMSVLVLASVGMGTAIKLTQITLKKLPIYPPNGKLLSSLPRETKSWMAYGADAYETGEVLETLGTTNYLTRAYVKKLPTKEGLEQQLDKKSVFEFHAAYYTGMIDTVPHVPDRCFVAGGMQLGDLTQDVALPLDRMNWRTDPYAPESRVGHLYTQYSILRIPVHQPRDPQDLKLHAMQFVSEGQNVYAGYFFIANGGAVPRAEDVRLLAFDLHSTYAYYLKVQFTSRTAESEEELAKMAASFLDDVFGDLMECVPDWTKVEAGEYPADNPAKGPKGTGAEKK